MDLNNFAAWFGMAKPGESIVYYTGYLPTGRQPENNKRTGQKTLPDSSWVAARALDECEGGFLALTQRRLGNFRYEYIATKIEPRPKKPARNTGPRQPVKSHKRMIKL